jgi:hypothetical protein
MQMRETVRSLRLYFILSGLAGALISGSALRIYLQRNAAAEAAMRAMSVVLSLAFIYVGFRLSTLLRTSPGRVVAVLYASGGWTVAVFLVGFFRAGRPVGLIGLLLVMLIVSYLLKNVQRLAEETRLASPGPASLIA